MIKRLHFKPTGITANGFALLLVLILIACSGGSSKMEQDQAKLHAKSTSTAVFWRPFEWDEPFIDETADREAGAIADSFSPSASTIDNSPALTWPHQAEEYGKFFGIPILTTTGEQGQHQAFDRMYLLDEESRLYLFNPRSPGLDMLASDDQFELGNSLNGYNMSSVVVSLEKIFPVPASSGDTTDDYVYALDNDGGIHIFIDQGFSPEGDLLFYPLSDVNSIWDPDVMSTAYGFGEWDFANTSPAILDSVTNTADIVFSGHNSEGNGSLNCLKLRSQSFGLDAVPDDSSWSVSLAGAGGLSGELNIATTPVIANPDSGHWVYVVVTNYGSHSPSAALVVYDLDDGTELDSVFLPDGNWYDEPSNNFYAIQATPCYRIVGAQKAIYVPSPNAVYSFDATTLALRESFNATVGHKIYSSVIPQYYSVIDGTPSAAHGIYIVENHIANSDWRVRFLHDDGLSGTTPAELWRSNYFDGTVKSQPLMDNENLYVVDDNEMFAFEPFDLTNDTFNSSPDSASLDSVVIGDDLRSSPAFNGKDSNQMDQYLVYLATDRTLSGGSPYGQVHAFRVGGDSGHYDVGGNVEVDDSDAGCEPDEPGVGINVQLEFEDGGSYNTLTDANGDYFFGNVPAGSAATIRCVTLDYETHTPPAHNFSNLSSDLLNLDFALTDDCCEDSWMEPDLDWNTWGLEYNQRKFKYDAEQTAPDVGTSNLIDGKISATPVVVKDSSHLIYAPSSDGTLYEFEWSGSFLVGDDVNTPLAAPASDDELASAAVDHRGLVHYTSGDTYYVYNPETSTEYAHYTVGGDRALSSVGCYNVPLTDLTTVFVSGSTMSGDNDKLYCFTFSDCGIVFEWELQMEGTIVGAVHMPAIGVTEAGVVLVNTVDGSNQVTLNAIEVSSVQITWQMADLGTAVPHTSPFEVEGLWGVVTKERIKLFEAPMSEPTTPPEELEEYSLSPFNAPQSREITSPCAIRVIDNTAPTPDDAQLYVQGQTSAMSSGFIIRYTLSTGTADVSRAYGLYGMLPVLAGTGAPALDSNNHLYVPGKNHVLTFDGDSSSTRIFLSTSLGTIYGSITMDTDGRFYVPAYISGTDQSRLFGFGNW